MNRPYVVAVTGGIGAGKTTVCRRFAARHGVPVVDADQVARDVVAPGQPGLAEVVAAFGPEVLGADGALDRARLRTLVFADAERRRRLEAILHPRIRAAMRDQIAALDAPYCLVGIPLLAEGGRGEFVDRVLVVDCPEAVQVARVAARDHLTETEVAAIMRTQATREERLRLADDVLVNDVDPAALDARVDALNARYLELAAAP